jgi:ATP synthase protein I
MDHFQRLQRRLIVATVVAAVLAVPSTAWFFGVSAAFSLMVGSLAGLLYLKLLARSVSRLGVATKSVGKAQLLVPLLLVFAATRLPHLQVVPALVGFLLYKPALLVQALLDG